jgi:hypothetical protein
MGRSILGVVVGLVASFIGAGVLVMVLAGAVGADGIAVDKVPTTMWVALMLVVTGATSYLGGAIARAIGKEKRTTYIYLGLIVVLTVVSLAMSPGEPPKPPPGQPEPEGYFKTLAVMGEAMYNVPAWYKFANPVLSLLGIALGGLNKSDFAAPVAPQPQG